MMQGKAQNYGNEVTLDGTNPNASGKLIRVEDVSPMHTAWLLAVSGNIDYPNLSLPWIAPVAQGIFGSGGTAHKVEFDIKPDTLIAMPGIAVDLNVSWDQLLVANGATIPDTITPQRTTNGGIGVIPNSAKIRATVKHGLPSRPNATRTYTIESVNLGAAHLIQIPTPPFSDSVMLYLTNAAAYATLTSIQFINGSTIVTEYTGAEVTAIKNAGGFLPIPGSCEKVQLVMSGDQASMYLMFNLNL